MLTHEKKNGEKYRRNSLLGARGAIHRYIQSLKPEINLFKSPEFKKANSILDSVLKAKMRDKEEPAVQHKEGMTDGDLD